MTLTDIAIRNLRGKPGEGDKAKPYKVSDSGGLYILVQPDGSRYWRLAYRFSGKQKTLALGVYPSVTLLEARKKRDAAKEQIKQGIDPSHSRKLEKLAAQVAAANSFESVAREWHENQLERWTPEHAGRTIRRLERDAFSVIGARPIAEIEAPELLIMLRRVEARGALDIAKRIKEHCSQIFRYGVVTGRARRDPTLDLRGALKAAPPPVHRAAMPRSELPEFLRKLQAYDGEPTTRLALRLVLLTFVRTKELRAASWAEIEGLGTGAPIWRIPAARMKLRREHIVPLAPQSVAVIEDLRPLTGMSEYLFPSPSKKGFMSENTMLFALYRMGWHGRATVHGFRGVASTALNEAGFNADWVERQLAHDTADKVRGAYNSAQYLDPRRQMMHWWADHLDTLS